MSVTSQSRVGGNRIHLHKTCPGFRGHRIHLHKTCPGFRGHDIIGFLRTPHSFPYKKRLLSPQNTQREGPSREHISVLQLAGTCSEAGTLD